MKQAVPLHSSYAALFDPAVALAAAQRAAQWDLPRHICHPLDHYHGRRVNLDLAAFDAEVDSAPVSEEELVGESQSASSSGDDRANTDIDGDDDGDL